MADPYHIGVEDIHFVSIGSPSVNVSAGRFRPEWVRCGLQADVSVGTDQRWRGPLEHMSVSTDDFWLTFRLYQSGTSIAGSTGFVSFSEGGQWRLGVYAPAGQLPQLYKFNDIATSGPVFNTAAINDPDNTLLMTGILPVSSLGRLGKVDINVDLTGGFFKIFVDHILVFGFSGDLTGGEFSTINHYDLQGSRGNAVFSEVVWHPEDTRKIVGVRGVWPYGDGFQMDWTGVKADVDEIVVDEQDANYTDTVGLTQEYTIPPLPSGLTGNVLVGAVMLGARMATNPTDEAVVIRTDGTDFPSDSYDTGGAIEDRMYIWGTNPDTTVPFTKEEINDIDFNIGVTST